MVSWRDPSEETHESWCAHPSRVTMTALSPCSQHLASFTQHSKLLFAWVIRSGRELGRCMRCSHCITVGWATHDAYALVSPLGTNALRASLRADEGRRAARGAPPGPDLHHHATYHASMYMVTCPRVSRGGTTGSSSNTFAWETSWKAARFVRFEPA